jgi:outer membrane immunogenic protein
MRNRSAVVGLFVLATLVAIARGQSMKTDGFVSHTQVSLMYNYVRANDIPQPTGQPTGFALNGISAAGAYAWKHHLSGVVDLGGTHVNGVGNTGQSLTLLTYLFGARYSLPKVVHLEPFAQILLGGVHAYGGIYPATVGTSGGADTFAATGGGGADFPLNHHISLRGQLEYLYTGLPNGGTNRQSDLRVGGGIVVHFGVR